MTFIQAVIYSIVEGVSEFLPISSTGHLILASDILRISQSEFIKSFEIIIQLGAILAVVVLYFNALTKNLKLWKSIIIAFIPTGILGLTLYRVIKQYLLGSTSITLWSLLIGGVALIILELRYKEQKHHLDSVEKVSPWQAVGIGLFQSIAMIPGVSRSAASIFGGMFLGLKRQTAVEFSFMLAIPTMLAASGLDLFQSRQVIAQSGNLALLATGFAGSFIVALLTIKFFLNYIQKNNFIPFGIYRIIAAIIFWLVAIR
ncbi:undecaprenyl-diphosphate phosphatase [Candidatus Daviesbacteria bacterium]|nr:undecaprenyl-diphosphate phosphatase [Candidatus Daviesbacteria bacterium]